MAVKAVLDLDEETIPAWQRQSMQRSLRSAQARAHVRSDRFVAAATRLLQEKGSADFTVQDVVDRSKMSIRTFYKYFEAKKTYWSRSVRPWSHAKRCRASASKSTSSRIRCIGSERTSRASSSSPQRRDPSAES